MTEIDPTKAVTVAGLYLVVIQNNRSQEYESRTMYIVPGFGAAVRECYDFDARVTYYASGGFFVDPDTYTIKKIYLLAGPTAVG